MAKKKGKSKATRTDNVVNVQNFASQPTTSQLTNVIILGTVCQPMKVCRLCESKDGPFLNIFDAEKVTANKIGDLMPFEIAENDELPHKICFRCSAKVEELYEFIQKCINTQRNLRTALGKKEPLVTKTKSRIFWEDKLSRTNALNDDICDAVIKRAMEGIIKDSKESLIQLPVENKSSVHASVEHVNMLPKDKETNNVEVPIHIKEGNKDVSINSDVKRKPVKLILGKSDQQPTTTKSPEQQTSSTRSSRSKMVEPLINGLETPTKGKIKKKINSSNTIPDHDIPEEISDIEVIKSANDDVSIDDIISIDGESDVEHEAVKAEVKVQPFNIMEHISTIKVNGVGVLYQCKLCNRNFLNKDVVKSHACAKIGVVPKEDIIKNVIAPEPPKASTVKYINTKSDVDKTHNTTITTEIKLPISAESKPDQKMIKTKPKMGPASKVRRNDSNQVIGTAITTNEIEPAPGNPVVATVQCPTIPSLNCPYKLIPGPNNTYTLVEEKPVNSHKVKDNMANINDSRKRSAECFETHSKEQYQNTLCETKKSKMVQNMINIEIKKDYPNTTQHAASSQPYPVGLFQTVPNFPGVYQAPLNPEPVIFNTAIAKKHSYMVVQTDNPSKLLISTKPQPPQPTIQAVQRNYARKTNQLVKDTEPKPPFIGDRSTAKDSDFFTFVNVDPLLQPSYVLPTNTLLESQTVTSAQKNTGMGKVIEDLGYTCNICNETFTRQKKLFAHIQTHRQKMDEEEEIRGKSVRKRGKKFVK